MIDVIIIGAGAAGMSAALYCLRAGLSTTLLEKEWHGGQLAEINNLQNYPGYEGSGAELAEKMFDPLIKFDQFNMVYETAQNVSYDKLSNLYTVSLEFSTPLLAKEVIFATGTKPRRYFPIEYDNVHYCALCDGGLYQNKKLVVIGGGNSAYDAAIYLRDLGNEVTILYRGETPRAEKALQDIAWNKNIRTYTNIEPTKFQLNEEGNITQIHWQDIIFDVDGIFVEIGREVSGKELYEGLEDPLIADGGHQVVLACAEGTKAALKAIDRLKNWKAIDRLKDWKPSLAK